MVLQGEKIPISAYQHYDSSEVMAGIDSTVVRELESALQGSPDKSVSAEERGVSWNGKGKATEYFARPPPMNCIECSGGDCHQHGFMPHVHEQPFSTNPFRRSQSVPFSANPYASHMNQPLPRTYPRPRFATGKYKEERVEREQAVQDVLSGSCETISKFGMEGAPLRRPKKVGLWPSAPSGIKTFSNRWPLKRRAVLAGLRILLSHIELRPDGTLVFSENVSQIILASGGLAFDKVHDGDSWTIGLPLSDRLSCDSVKRGIEAELHQKK